MAKQKNPTVIDFDSGEVVEDETNTMRAAQRELYRLDNPYVGNKRKIVVDIAKSFEKHGVEFDTMADVFSGSSVVGLFFKLLGKRVLSNDLLTSSYMNAMAFVENSKEELTPAHLEYLCKYDNPDKRDFVRTNYVKRFTPEEALFLDNYRANIDSLFGPLDFAQGDATPRYRKPADIQRALATVMIEHYVMSHCFLGGRLNSGQILAKLEHRLQHQRNDGHEMSFKLDALPVFAGKDCKAHNLDCLDFLDGIPDVDLCYIDPPYGGAQSDYASMFAFCEEYVYGKSLDGLPHIANSKKFVSAKDFEIHFRDVLSRAAKRAKIVAVSFNDSSWADSDKVQSILKDYKTAVKVINMDYEYKYRKERGSATEYLFIAQ
jgi:adenine-specific DNA-methyltransferase